MANDIPLEKRFAVLSEITRAQHFAWRAAVRELCPDVDPRTVVQKMWEVTGAETARAYVKRIDRSLPLAPQVAAGIAWSSRCMGEDAQVEIGSSSNESFVRHEGCPWLEWHRRHALVEEDRQGCDAWFRATVAGVNDALGSDVRVQTLETLPDGASSCLRRIWVETA